MSENIDQEPIDPNQKPENPQREEQFKNEKDPTRIHIQKKPSEIITGLAGFVKSTLSLRDGSYDVQGVISNVKEGIVFSGYNVWILMCSIIVASVGLNMDSTAVIIGAMLISPLMGPIRGIGFGVGMNDFKLLIESLKNFGITVGIALLTSFLYFLVTPLHDSTSELFGRTEPNFLDVVIAFFGGLAGVIAQSKNKADTVIPGVAIATALMPPLCTAGYGLANGEWAYFFGAFYLFILNTILIAGSTYLFIRYLKFPKKEYVVPKTEKRVRAYTLAFIIIALGPSVYMFYRMTMISIFEGNADSFVEEVVMNTDDNIMVDESFVFDWKESYIDLEIRNYYADEFVIGNWKKRMADYELDDVQLNIKQGIDINTTISEALENYDASQRGANTLAGLLADERNRMINMEQQLNYLKDNPILKEDPLRMDHLLTVWKVDYPEYERVRINRNFELGANNQIDTVYALTVLFKENIPDADKPKINSKISRRFQLELALKSGFAQDSIHVLEVTRE